MNRRSFNLLLAGSMSAVVTSGARALAGPSNRLSALAFDGFALFDAKPVFDAVEKLFPAGGAALGSEWRRRLFEYTWLRASGRRYADFEHCVEEALVYAARATKIPLSADARDGLLAAYANLSAFPDCAGALRKLKSDGLRLVILANPTPKMLQRAVENAQLSDVFEDIISTDRARTFKPDPAAYQLGVDSLKLPAEKVGFVASAGWDAAGAEWFGYPSFWINRQGAPAEELGAPGIRMLGNMAALPQAVFSG